MPDVKPATTLLTADDADISKAYEEALGDDLRHFFENVPPNTDYTISSKRFLPIDNQLRRKIYLPDPILIYCPECNGAMHHSPTQPERHFSFDAPTYKKPWTISFFADFQCRNCQVAFKRYAVFASLAADNVTTISKYGERPRMVIRVGPKARELLRPDADMLNKALEAESAGLGIGAYVYYRRILERQKARIFERVITAAEKLGADAKEIADLKAGMDERQFTKALEKLGAGPLRAIYLGGHNPLTLLYDEVSDGVHAGEDADNLESATRIRVVLTHLAETLGSLLADRKEVEGAVNAMLKSQRERKAAKNPQ